MWCDNKSISSRDTSWYVAFNVIKQYGFYLYFGRWYFMPELWENFSHPLSLKYFACCIVLYNLIYKWHLWCIKSSPCDIKICVLCTLSNDLYLQWFYSYNFVTEKSFQPTRFIQQALTRLRSFFCMQSFESWRKKWRALGITFDNNWYILFCTKTGTCLF